MRTLEGVSRGLDVELFLEALEIVQQGRDQLGLDDALEDRVAVTRDALEVAGGGPGFLYPIRRRRGDPAWIRGPRAEVQLLQLP
jgi:hypothetical protein